MATITHDDGQQIQGFGLMRGPGTGTSDSIPAALSDGEVVIPADDVRRFGAAQIMSLVKKGGLGLPKPKVKQGIAHAAVGGLMEQAQVRQVDNSLAAPSMGGRMADPAPALGAVNRVGNSYSGGNVSGPISVNGQAPAGTLSLSDAYKPPAPPPAAGLGAIPSATTPASPAGLGVRPPASGLAPQQQPGATPTGQSPMDTLAQQIAQRLGTPPAQAAPAQPVDRNADFFAAAAARNEAARQPYGFGARRLGYATGGLVEEEAKRLLQPDAQYGGAAFGVFPQMPRGGTDANPPPTQAQVRVVDNAPANASAIQTAPVAAPVAPAATAVAPAAGPASFEPAGTVTDLGGFGVGSAARVAQMGRDQQHLRDLGSIQQRIDANNGQAPGLVAIDGAGAEADRRAQFNEGANLRNALARTSWSPRRGTQGDDVAVQAALNPIQQRAAAAAQAAQNAGDTQRTLIQERATSARTAAQSAQQQEANAIDRARLGIDEKRLGIEAGKAVLTANKEAIQQGKDTQDIFGILEQATPLLQQSTNSVVGNGIDKVAQLFGVSTKGAEAGAQLKALQGALVAKMPKMSGPQSDKDVQLYREMAGQIGDATIPREQRLAAMQTIQAINTKYLPAPTDASGFAGLPSGATFRAPDGSIRRKP